MGYVIARLKLLPKEPGITGDKLHDAIQANLPNDMSIRQMKDEPIAFGLFAIFVDIYFEEKDGAMNALESSIDKIDQISEFETVAVSKASTKIG